MNAADYRDIQRAIRNNYGAHGRSDELLAALDAAMAELDDLRAYAQNPLRRVHDLSCPFSKPKLTAAGCSCGYFRSAKADAGMSAEAFDKRIEEFFRKRVYLATDEGELCLVLRMAPEHPHAIIQMSGVECESIVRAGLAALAEVK